MKKRIKLFLTLFIAISFISGFVIFSFAEDDAGLKIGLKEAVRRALITNEEIKIKEQEVSKALGLYRETRSDMLPQINADVVWARNLDYPAKAASLYSDYEFDAGISATQVIWSFGKIIYAVNAANKTVEASRFNKLASEQDVIYNAKLSYFSSLLARNALAITEKSYTNALENKKLLGERSYGGRSPKYEIIRMNAEVAARVPNVNEARTQFDAATETLRKVIDVDLNCKIELAGDFKEEYNDFDYEVLVVAMYEYEPTLKSFDKAIESAEEKVKSKYASFFPTISAFGTWDYLGKSNEHPFLNNDELDQYRAAGLEVSVPIWEGGVKQAQLMQSKSDREIAVLKKRQLSRNLLLELKKASLEYKQYKDNLKANIEAVNLAEESFKQTQQMFAAGQVALTDVNDAELLLTNQRLNKEMTLFSINITLARIEKLITGEYDERKVKKS